MANRKISVQPQKFRSKLFDPTKTNTNCDLFTFSLSEKNAGIPIEVPSKAIDLAHVNFVSKWLSSGNDRAGEKLGVVGSSGRSCGQ
jgi:hypothetical protein